MKLPDTDDYTFGDWLESTAKLQIVAYGRDPVVLMEEEHFVGDGAMFFTWNAFAAIAEITEMAEVVGWKPWATSRHVDRGQVIEEAVDAMHFLANILRMVDCSGKELTEAYKAKQQKNLKRQRDGYTGIKETHGSAATD